MLRLRVGLRHAEKLEDIYLKIWRRIIIRNMQDGTAGESWTLGDSPAVGVVLDPDCGFYHETEAPIILDDTTNKFEKGRPKTGCIHRWIRGLFWKILLRNWKFYMERVPIQNRYKKDV